MWLTVAMNPSGTWDVGPQTKTPEDTQKRPEHREQPQSIREHA